MLRVRKSLEGAGGWSGWWAAQNDSGGQQMKPVSGTNIREVGFSRVSTARCDAGWSAATNDSEGQQVKPVSAGDSKGSIELHEVAATSTLGDRACLRNMSLNFLRILQSVQMRQQV